MLANVGLWPTVVVMAAGCLLLSACGGGGGSAATAATNTPLRSPTQTRPVATATPTPLAPTATQTPIPSSTAVLEPTHTPSPPPSSTETADPTPPPTNGGGATTPTEPSCPMTATPEVTATAVPSATNTPLLGPEVTALGVADATGSPLNPAGIENGAFVYRTQFGNGFIVFVEGRPGATGLRVGTRTDNRSPFDASVRPDLQIQVDRPLGDGSPASCDNSAPTLGGVPAISPPDFAVTQTISDTLNDLSCRFSTFDESQFPCTQDRSANFAFVDANTTRQFCVLISNAISFQPGDTRVTARLRDSGGNAGPAATILVRVVQ